MGKISFELVTEKDFTTLHVWLKSEHLQWWYDGWNDSCDEFVEWMRNRISNTHQFCYIFAINNIQVWYIQCYDCYGLAKDVYESLVDQWTWWIDMYIGDSHYMGKWIGSLVLQEFVEYVKAHHKAIFISIDPTPDNIRAIKSYQKSGFNIIQEFEIDGNIHVLMMYQA